MNQAEKTMLVLGLGESGIAMARLAVRDGYRLRVADSRHMPVNLSELARLAPQAQLVMGDLPMGLLEGADIVALSPGLSRNEPVVREAIARGIEVVGEIELFSRELAKQPHSGEVIAITGTNGKTTVTSMVGAMARHAGRDSRVAGNISPAALSVLLDCDAESVNPDLWVLELSSFQLETTRSLRPVAAAVLNLTEDHLDRYFGMAEYAAAKARIFHHAGCAQVLNRHDPNSLSMAVPGRRLVTFGLDAPGRDEDFGLLEMGGYTWLAQGKKPLMVRDQLLLAGEHNVANALAALALGYVAGLPERAMIEALIQFRGLPHRVEPVLSYEGIDFLDDSKGTNVGATAAAIRGLGRPAVVILGGDGKGQSFEPLHDVVAEHARAAVLIGADAQRIGEALNGCGVPVVFGRDMRDAVVKSLAYAKPGDAVLLSPACASFDMFRSYQHRAEVFIKAVRELCGYEGGK